MTAAVCCQENLLTPSDGSSCRLGRMFDPGTFTRLTALARDGDDTAHDKAFSLVYDELRSMARTKLYRNAANSLQATELVHEMYQRLAHKKRLNWNDRSEFFGLAARAMHDILVERARAAITSKRGGDHTRVSLTSAVVAAQENPEGFLILDQALSRLAEEDGLTAEIVRLRYIVGLGGDEVAELLKISPSTVDRRWAYAKAWLHEAIYG